MLYKTKVAVCSENKWTGCNQQVEFLSTKPDEWYVKFLAGFKRIILAPLHFRLNEFWSRVL